MNLGLNYKDIDGLVKLIRKKNTSPTYASSLAEEYKIYRNSTRVRLDDDEI